MCDNYKIVERLLLLAEKVDSLTRIRAEIGADKKEWSSESKDAVFAGKGDDSTLPLSIPPS